MVLWVSNCADEPQPTTAIAHTFTQIICIVDFIVRFTRSVATDQNTMRPKCMWTGNLSLMSDVSDVRQRRAKTVNFFTFFRILRTRGSKDQGHGYHQTSVR